MPPTEPIQRRTLSDEACDRLRDWIAAGRLTSDERVSEPILARALGISRTPLRHAIAQLGREGLLEIETGRGFRVTPLNAELVREIYPVLGALEAMALRLTPPDRLPDVVRLRELNAVIVAPGTRKSRLYEADRDLHAMLSAGCPNRRVLSLLEEHRRLGARFDGAMRRGMHAREKSHAEHEAIIAAITKKRLDLAATLVQQHYLAGIETVIDWLENEEKTR